MTFSPVKFAFISDFNPTQLIVYHSFYTVFCRHNIYAAIDNIDKYLDIKRGN